METTTDSTLPTTATTTTTTTIPTTTIPTTAMAVEASLTEAKILEYRAAFAGMDAVESGVLSPYEISLLVRDAGHQVNKKTLDQLARRQEVVLHGGVTVDLFLELVGRIHSWKDQMRALERSLQLF
eukprot:Filipodium_phascolosomae@DN4164_c0_g1_i1.p1